MFDPRSRTETDYDWVDITQEPDENAIFTHTEKRGHTGKYHGCDGQENFPGFGGRPPLWLDGDRFIARFRSDPITTDWGVRFTAYGVLDDRDDCDPGGQRAELPVVSRLSDVTGGSGILEPGARADNTRGHTGTAAATAATATTDAAGRAGTLDVDMCCWLLESLSREGWDKVPDMAARLCGTDALGIFRDCLKAFSQRRRLRVLRLVSCVIAEATLTAASRANPRSLVAAHPVAPHVRDVDALLRVVLELMDAQRVKEDGPVNVSPYLQALVQCVVLIRNFLDAMESPRVSDKKAADYAPATIPAVAEGGLPSSCAEVEAVQAVGAILFDFAQGTTPVQLLQEEFLPTLTEACSVTVQSSHPFDRRSQRRVVTVPGAIEMQARFDHRTEMGEDDRIVIRDPSRRAAAGSSKQPATKNTGAPATTPDEESVVALSLSTREAGSLLSCGGELSFVGLAGGTGEENLPVISVGDWVVRGPDWAFGDEDGGGRQGFPTGVEALSALSGAGVVVALEKWCGRDGAGARVRWPGEETESSPPGGAMGRNAGKGFEALYSVRDPAHIRVVKRGGSDRARRPVVVAADTLEVEVMPGGGEAFGGASGDEVSAQSAGGDGGSVGRNRARYFRFDGESTHVDLPNYRGMRLEGDFTMELWAWLEPGVAQDGKPKCLFSRALDQSLHQGRRATAGGRTPPGQDTSPSNSAACIPGGSREGASPPLPAVREDVGDSGSGAGDGHSSAQPDSVRDAGISVIETEASSEWSWSTPSESAPTGNFSEAGMVPSTLPAISDSAVRRFGDENTSPIEDPGRDGAPATAVARDEGRRRTGEWEWVGEEGRSRTTASPPAADGPPLSFRDGDSMARDGDDSGAGGEAGDEEDEMFLLEDDDEEDEEEDEVEDGEDLESREAESGRVGAGAASNSATLEVGSARTGLTSEDASSLIQVLRVRVLLFYDWRVEIFHDLLHFTVIPSLRIRSLRDAGWFPPAVFQTIDCVLRQVMCDI